MSPSSGTPPLHCDIPKDLPQVFSICSLDGLPSNSSRRQEKCVSSHNFSLSWLDVFKRLFGKFTQPRKGRKAKVDPGAKEEDAKQSKKARTKKQSAEKTQSKRLVDPSYIFVGNVFVFFYVFEQV